MNRVIIVIAALIGVGVIAYLVSPTRKSAEPAEFAPYMQKSSATTGSAPETTSGGAAPPEMAPPALPPKPNPAVGAETEDTLNRPGPLDEETIAARRIENRRPRADEPVGKQDAPPRGTLAKEDVRKGIQAVKPMLAVCYESLLDEFPSAKGEVTLGFRIIGEDGKGRVEMTELDEDGTTLFDEKLHDCLQKRVSEAEFSVPSGGGVVDVRYPFVFANEADADEAEE